MFQKMIELAIARRWLIVFVVACLGALGVHSYARVPIDAVPDITNVQVQINTAAHGYSPLEVEQRITFPIETVMSGLPRLESTRSLSKYGLSQVTVVFKDGTDIYFARQLVSERLQEARSRLPAGVEPAMGPTATGLGEIFYWTVETKEGARKADGSPYTPADLREIQDWIVAPQLRSVKGVTEVNTIGGYLKEYQVAPDLAKLSAHGLSLATLVNAIDRNNANAGAGYIERGGEQFVVRTPGQVKSLEEIRNIVLDVVQGAPVRVRDVADVELGRELRTGAATENGREVVLGAVFMLIGENSRAVAQAARLKLEDVNRSLPPGVQALPVYDRSVLVNKAIDTVRRNLVEGALLVIAILFLFLGNLRAALITALVIPLSMLMVFTGMVQAGVSANLMSLGALDFGIIVDGAVVIVENCIRRLGLARTAAGRSLTREERFAEVAAAAAEARRPLLFGQLIIMTVYLPIFALSGIEGRMFHPMAITVVMALLAAMILSITFVPAAVALFVKEGAEHENRLMAKARALYRPLLDWVLANRPVAFTFAALSILLSGLLATRLGTEFAPNLDEGDLAVLTMRIPGTSLAQSVAMQQHLESTLLKQFPEIERMFARVGTSEVATDPMPPNAADSYIMLRPEKEWPAPRKSHAELVAAITAAAAQIPGNNYEFSQPIQLRFNELISGVRSDVAVKVFGDDTAAMGAAAQRIARVLGGIPGAAEVKVEQTEGLPALTLSVDRIKAARYGLNVADVQEAFGTLVGGRDVGMVFEGDRRFAITVRLPEGVRNDVDSLRQLPLALPAKDKDGHAASIPLSEVATLGFVPEANQISRENGKRRIVVTANVRGRDLGSFVAEFKPALAKVALPPGTWVGLGGQFENLEAASARLAIVVPAALALVFALLYLMFNSVKDGLLVFSGIPFAMTGGVLALWLRGLPLSISAAVGFIALSGVAVLNGLVMVSFVRTLREAGHSAEAAMREGADVRLRAVLMTALVASLGFLPMALATSTGAEVQRPLATVVIGGILSSTVLTLLILPALYVWAHGGNRRS
ncbi:MULTISPECIES: efflux RND transporter permease subunit [unclassified Massilia]|uniref:efflux RND transporter permease subunit n=1 Tax=unclassified Massilia TaxID=2609279 RepID=UPI001783BBCB|nr:MULTISPECIES: CusA/CzcA family heavy metal efflux RND transporter [unclassified Massilia]MBD8533359.1 CusA/CzcA family heavy metal efflux RND transporter [Massilia sp. CFBP 13647]MBD8676752.1 CusA/CzcA family heavy metal efflux RND transporter [Massilia sp. CFBP 13721]